MEQNFEVGTVVYSIAGRDQGRFFVVVEVVDDTFVKIADGDLRRVDTPKMKKMRHLRSQNIVLPKLAEKLVDGKKIFDAEVKAALRAYND